MKKLLFLLFAVFVILNNRVFADEPAETEKTEAEGGGPEEIYHYPEIKPEYRGLLGYRFVGLSGSAQEAAEYEYTHSSLSAGTEIRLFPFPHRIHLEADMLNERDYFIDLSYAYKDLIMFRGIDRTLFHNLRNIPLIDLNPSTTLFTSPAGPAVTRLDIDRRFGTTTSLNSLFLRLKTPDFPFHVYVDGDFVNKYGEMQQRFLRGTGYFIQTTAGRSGIERVSEGRTIDWQTRDITVGANSHLGPVEVDYSHSEKRFSPDSDNILSDSYLAAGTTPSRPAGVFPHNVIPDLKGSTDTIKLHTSYTGRLVASTTLSWTDRENELSGAKANNFVGSASITYIPDKLVTFVARYRHRESDVDNPSILPANYLGFASYTTSPTPTGITPSISSKVDTLSIDARYRPFKGLGLTAEYSYDSTKRENFDEWDLPETTIRRNVSLIANARLLKNLTLKAKYDHQDINNPSYNSIPERSDSGSISVSWIPSSWANVMVSYGVANERRHDIFFINEFDTVSTTPAKDRATLRDRLLASITFSLLKELSLTTSYAYIHNKIVQDLILNNLAGMDIFLDKRVPYKDIANSYTLALDYAPVRNIKINAEADYTIGNGNFYPNIPAALSPVSIASFSELKVREAGFSIGGDYTFKGDWTAGIRYRYNSFRDVIDNPFDDEENGIFRAVLVTLSKRW